MFKKVFIFISLIILTSLITSCSAKMKDLKKFFQNLDKEDASYQMVINSDVPLVGEITMTFSVEGNKMKQDSFMGSGDIYYEYVDDKVYKYQKNLLGNWKKEEVEDESDVFDTTQFDYDDFDFVDGEYVLKEDACEKYKVKALSVKVDKGHKSGTFTTKVMEEGINVEMEIIISKYGEVKVDLPTV